MLKELCPSSELISRIGQGDVTAFSDLYDRHAAAVYAVARRIVRDPADAEEVVLDAFVQAWKQAARFDSSRATAAGWLLMITRSRALDRLRHTEGRRRRDEDMRRTDCRITPQWATDHTLIREQDGREIRRALEALPVTQRIPVELAFYEGLTHSEIADVLCQPLGSVKTRIRLALQRMKGGLTGPKSQGPAHEPSPFAVALANYLATRPRLTPDYRSIAGLRVLVVDDDPETMYMVATVLQSAGATVMTAGSVPDALARLTIHWPDVVLADISMPREDGYSLLRAARALADVSGKPLRVAAFTALGSAEQGKALDAGFATLVSKPVQPQVLIDTVGRLARRAA